MFAQRDLSTLVGIVTDPSGAVIANATVVVTEISTNEVYTLQTNNVGEYIRPALKPFIYAVSVNARMPDNSSRLSTPGHNGPTGDLFCQEKGEIRLKKRCQIEQQRAVQQFRRIATEQNLNIQMILPLADIVGLLQEGAGNLLRHAGLARSTSPDPMLHECNRVGVFDGGDGMPQGKTLARWRPDRTLGWLKLLGNRSPNKPRSRNVMRVEGR